MTLRERIDAATTHEHKWNSWPDQLAVIKFRSVDLTNAREAYAYGYLLASPHEYRQIRFTNFPREVWPHLTESGWKNGDHSLVYTYFTLAAAKGQQDDPEKRNILVVTQPKDDYSNWKYKQGERPPYAPGLIIEIGCAHDYDDAGSNHTRGYHVGRCKRCGHKFMCDSGD